MTARHRDLPAPERELSQRELNRAVLARQLLLGRARVGLPQALERVAGIQAQYAPAMYVGLWTRLEGFERALLDAALEGHAVVQGTLMRATIHLVSPADFWPFALAVRRTRREQWLRTRRETTAPQMAGAARRLRGRLTDGPLRAREVDALVGRPHSLGVGLWLELLREPPSGTWARRRADLYALAEQHVPAGRVTPSQAVEHLVRSYLRGFGPASRRDITSFTGLAPGALAPTLGRMELRRFAGPDGQDLLDVTDGLLPDPRTEAPVRFLPVWDATLLVHARRTGILPEEFRSRIFTSANPHSLNTFLVDGSVAGSWMHRDGRIVLDPWTALDRATRRTLDEEAERLACLYQAP